MDSQNTKDRIKQRVKVNNIFKILICYFPNKDY